MSANVKYLALIDSPRKGQKHPKHSAEFLRSFMQETLGLIEEGLRRDGVVRIHEFGTFQLKWVNERKGRNPQTGAPLTIPGQYRVVFKPASKVENRINRRYAHLKAEIVEMPQPQARPVIAPPYSSLPKIAPLSDTPPERVPIPIFIRPPYPPRLNRIRFDFAEEEEENGYQEIEVGELEDVLTPASVKAVAQEEESSLPRKSASRVRWYGSFLMLFPLLLLLLVTPIRESEVMRPASEVAPKTEVNLNPTNGSSKPENGVAEDHEKPPAFAGGKHQVAPGDNLWQLSDQYYFDPYLWPNIYRMNTTVIGDPDVLEPQEELTLPILYGPHDQLTPRDRHNLAEGYFLVFDHYRQTKKHLAPFALWAAVRFDPQILETHSALITQEELAFLKAHDVNTVASR